MAPLLIALVAALTFANALANGFTLDDGAVIIDNPLVHDPSGIWRAFASSYWPSGYTGGQYRPLVIATYSFDWWISHGNPALLHAINVAWHVIASVLVFYFAVEM